MTRHVRVGYGRLAAGVLAVVSATWVLGATVAAAGSAAAVGRPAAAAAVTTTTSAASTPTGTGSATGSATAPPSGSGSGPVSGSSTSSTSCPGGPYNTGGTAAPPPSGFEDGTVGAWTADAGVTLTNTGEVAAQGSRSLRVTGVTDTGGANLPAGLSSQAQGYAWHRVTAQVRLAPGSAPAYVQLTPSGGYAQFPGVARVTADAWTTITAWFWPTTLYWDNYCNGQMYGGSYPLLASLKVLQAGTTCAEAPHGPLTLFVDNVTIERVESSAPPTGAPPEPASTPQCASVPSTPPSSPPAATCTARYSTVTQWGGGYVGSLHVVNTSSRTSSRWTLAWTFPGNQVVTSLWSAESYRQKGAQVTVIGPAWSQVAPGQGFDVGFVATGTAGTPRSVSLDGWPCTVSAAG